MSGSTPLLGPAYLALSRGPGELNDVGRIGPVNNKITNKLITKPSTDMKTKPTPNAPAPVLFVNENVSFEEQIAQRAHELWRLRSCEHGSDLNDWLQAEREINEWHQKRLQTRIL